MLRPLYEVVRAKLNAGVLPLEDPMRRRAGFGSGKQCSLCEQPIQSSHTEYELRYDNRESLQFHVVCHDLWDGERHSSRYRRRA